MDVHMSTEEGGAGPAPLGTGTLASINEPPGSTIGSLVPDSGGPPEVGVPSLTSLEPMIAAMGGPDLTLTCHGENFTGAHVIVFNGGVEPTTVVDATMLTTIVKPSLVGAPVSVPVLARGPDGDTAPLMFEFTAAP
jgi:hypothetical protein